MDSKTGALLIQLLICLGVFMWYLVYLRVLGIF